MNRPAAVFPAWAFAVACLATPAFGQLTLSTVQDGIETPVGPIYDFGPVATGDASDVVFRLKYSGSSASYYLTYFSVSGTGFSVLTADWTLLPAAVPAGGLNFTVHFEPGQLGSYSANLQLNQTDGISVILLGKCVPGLTVQAGGQALSAGQTVDFGNVQVGSTQTKRLTLANLTPAPLTVPVIQAPAGNDFTVGGPALAQPVVNAGASVELDVLFTPSAGGVREATLTIGEVSFQLAGVGVAPPPPVFPQPSIQVALGTTASAQQGRLSVNLASAPAAGGSGTVNLVFQPSVAGVADDPAVTFADGSRSAAFTVSPGTSATQFSGGSSSLAFGTGTTAGTLLFTVNLGSQTAQSSITVAPAAIGIDAAVAVRNVTCVPADLYCTATNVELEINGWDNTRTVSQLVFRFYDQSGNQIAPGDIPWSAGDAFRQYFAASDLGGVFGLHALFPITGDANTVTSAEVQLTNSAGTSQSARIQF